LLLMETRRLPGPRSHQKAGGKEGQEAGRLIWGLVFEALVTAAHDTLNLESLQRQDQTISTKLNDATQRGVQAQIEQKCCL